MQCRITPYEGNEPYIFVSYSHADSEKVFPILEYLEQCGFRIWYDGGIEWGEIWPKSIEEHLAGCEVCLAFHTEYSVKSRECKMELAYAADKCRCKLLSVYLDDVKLEGWLEMRTDYFQAAFAFEYENIGKFLSVLKGKKLLAACREDDDKEKINLDENNVEKSESIHSSELFYCCIFYPSENDTVNIDELLDQEFDITAERVVLSGDGMKKTESPLMQHLNSLEAAWSTNSLNKKSENLSEKEDKKNSGTDQYIS